MAPGTLCMIEPPRNVDRYSLQLAGLIVVTGANVGGVYWRVQPPAVVRVPTPWTDARGVDQKPGNTEVALPEPWLRPIDGARRETMASDDKSFAWG